MAMAPLLMTQCTKRPPTALVDTLFIRLELVASWLQSPVLLPSAPLSMADMKHDNASNPTSFVTKLFDLVSNGPDDIVGFIEGETSKVN
jgi:hypothetical protein